jgi:alpha-1,2-mannosyltransferase
MVYAHGGSLHESPSYDTGVYYAGADALIHGRLPYADFTLVHPPAAVLALTPFAALGRLTTDHVGFVIACLAWMALGAANSLLVMRIVRRAGLGVGASVVGGLGYAVWYEATRAEYATRLEPLGNCLLLLGVLALVASERSRNRLLSVGGGAALAAAASVKIWYAAPAVLVLGWHLIDRRPRHQLLWALAGAAGAFALIDGPFAVLAGRPMWQMIISDQLGRNRAGGTSIQRLAQITSSGLVDPSSSSAAIAATTALGAIVFAGLCVLGWRSRAGRLFVTLAGLQFAVVLVGPTFFPYYSDYLAPAMSLTVAAAAGTLLATGRTRQSVRGQRLRVAAAGLPILLVGGLALAIDVYRPLPATQPAPARALQHSVASARCVQSNTPMALIQLDVLSRDLANGCEVWVDVIGRSYSPQFKAKGGINGRAYRRSTYPPWQNALIKYLRSGDAVVVVEPAATGINRRTLREVNRGPVLGRSGAYVVHGT